MVVLICTLISLAGLTWYTVLLKRLKRKESTSPSSVSTIAPGTVFYQDGKPHLKIVEIDGIGSVMVKTLTESALGGVGTRRYVWVGASELRHWLRTGQIEEKGNT